MQVKLSEFSHEDADPVCDTAGTREPGSRHSLRPVCGRPLLASTETRSRRATERVWARLRRNGLVNGSLTLRGFPGTPWTRALTRREGAHSLGHDAPHVAGVQRGVLLLLLRWAVHRQELSTEKAALLQCVSQARHGALTGRTQRRCVKAASARTALKAATAHG